jgi:aryl-alcohol dehydrogenase-like predicted oxidoreductase
LERGLEKGVKEENFRELYGCDGLRLSFLAHGSSSGVWKKYTDFRHYCALKYTIMNGAVNHIDTGVYFRRHKSERVIGEVLKTLSHKYGIQRDEVFINTKLGKLEIDEYEDCPVEIQYQEFIANEKLKYSDFS